MQWSAARVLARLHRRPQTAELALATTAMASCNFAMLGVASAMPLIREDLHLSGPEIGLAAGSPFAVAFLTTFVAAPVTERYGPRFAVGVSQIFIVLSPLLVAVAPTKAVLFAGVPLAGVAYGLVNPAANVLSTGTISLRHRALAMSVKQTGVTIGGTVAGLLVPGVATLTSWRVALCLPAIAGVGVGLWAFASRERTPSEPLVLDDLVVPIRRSTLAFYGFSMGGIQLAIFGYATVYLVDEGGLSPQVAGLAFAVALASGTAGRLLWGFLSDLLRERVRVLQVAAGGSALMLLLVPYAPGPAIWPLLAAVGLCSVGWNGVYNTAVAESAGFRGVEHATSFFLPFLYLGLTFVPPALGFVVEHTSWAWFWWLGAMGAATACALLFSRPPVAVR